MTGNKKAKHRKKSNDLITTLFGFYNKQTVPHIYLPQMHILNFSQYIMKNFYPDVYAVYVYDLKSAYNFVYLPKYLISKYNLSINITRDYTKLKHFDLEKDFLIEKIPNCADNSRYIKKIINTNEIRKVSTEYIILKNISRYLLVDPEDQSKIYSIYKSKEQVPIDTNYIIQEVIAKPKIIIRTFYNFVKNKLLIQYSRYYYDVDSLTLVNYNNTYEFIRYVSNVYIEIAQK